VRLTAKEVKHSNVVGGGLMLCDATGRARFIVNFIGIMAQTPLNRVKCLK
jgi:hypothetical protein